MSSKPVFYAGPTISPSRGAGSLTDLFDAIPFPLALLDWQARLHHANKALQVNWCPFEVEFFTDLIDIEDRSDFLAGLRRCKAGADGQMNCACRSRTVRCDGLSSIFLRHRQGWTHLFSSQPRSSTSRL
ncbi:hypothetical protein [Rhizobium sp.]|uniref:hypothetical protein n=1 Tax=Rhizobium sp. TaxID=391 RepID=UPI0028A07CBA